MQFSLSHLETETKAKNDQIPLREPKYCVLTCKQELNVLVGWGGSSEVTDLLVETDHLSETPGTYTTEGEK